MLAVPSPESFSLGVSLLLEELEGGMPAVDKPPEAKAMDKLPDAKAASSEDRSLVRLPTPARRSGPSASSASIMRDSSVGHDRGAGSTDDIYSFPIPTEVTDFWQDLDNLMASLERQEQGECTKKTEADRIPGGILVHERARAPSSAEGLSIQGFNPMSAAKPGAEDVELQSQVGPSRRWAVTFAETAGLNSMKYISFKKADPLDSSDDIDLADMFARM